MPDYTKWCQVVDVLGRLQVLGVNLRVPSAPAAERVQSAIDEVTGEVAIRTLRNFLPGPPNETRTYDGTGTAELEVDEIIELVSAVVVGIQSAPGYTLANVKTIFEQNKPTTRLVVAVGAVPAMTTEGAFIPYQWVFPAGRQNIVVTGTFGYGAQIPAALWNAVLDEAVRRVAQEAIFNPAGGIVVSWELESAKQQFMPGGITALGAARKYADALRDWKRPAGRRLRNLRPRMM